MKDKYFADARSYRDSEADPFVDKTLGQIGLTAATIALAVSSTIGVGVAVKTYYDIQHMQIETNLDQLVGGTIDK